ncbi:MAG: Ni/Fe hydrogenase subunit alpha [Desulfobacula sp.]|jgi:F420-non-reducing hydrogenase large subunit
MPRSITIKPITRIEGHASIHIQLDEQGNVEDTKVAFTSLRGFEKFVEGKPAEELPGIVSRICGICPWMHHIASNKAVDACFRVTPPRAGNLLRELMLTMAHIEDKLLHFFFLSGADFFFGPGYDYSVRNIMGLVKANPELAGKVVKMRNKAKMVLDGFSHKTIHPVVGVPGGFAKPLSKEDRTIFIDNLTELLDFSCFSMDYAKKEVFPKFEEFYPGLGDITTGFISTVDSNGALNLYDGDIRLMKPDGTFTGFRPEDYLDHLAETTVPFSYGAFSYAKSWGEGFSLDHDAHRGIYRSNTLARINVADRIATPKAGAELEAFRDRFGRPAQSTLLYHHARLIEAIYACERALELLKDPEITSTDTRIKADPSAGRGVGCVEAPRGTLIHDYSTDENGLITRVNIIVGTTHNLAPINLSVGRAARDLIRNGGVDDHILNRIEMAVRAYDP